MIKNLTPTLSERGKIKIGIKGKKTKSSKGNEFQLPQKLDHFRVVTTEIGDDGNFIRDDTIHSIHGDAPTSLPIRLLYDDIELNFMTRYACYQGKKIFCSGDGETSRRIGFQDPGGCPCEKQDQKYQDKDPCKLNGVLSLIIEGAETVGGVWKFRTTGYHSVTGILSSLSLIKSVSGGILAGLPLNMKVTPKLAANPKTGQQITIYVVSIEYEGSFDQLRGEGYSIAMDRKTHDLKIENIESEARKMIAYEGDMMGDASDVVEEFYPDQVTDEIETGKSFAEKLEQKDGDK